MKSLYALAAIVAFSAAPAFAGEGHVSVNSLAKMGLSSMKSMDDAQGMKIRGTSIAIASGTSFAVQFGGGGGWLGQHLDRRRPPQRQPEQLQRRRPDRDRHGRTVRRLSHARDRCRRSFFGESPLILAHLATAHRGKSHGPPRRAA